MPFVHELLRYRSVAVVGLEKNVGKTVCLNYILGHLPASAPPVAVTSIGVDGEPQDALTGQPKPAVRVDEGMLFATSETHLPRAEVTIEVLDVSTDRTALGRIVTARALSAGRVLLSGPSTGHALSRWMSGLERFGVGLTLVDGALSRLSSASPALAEAMILATGASVGRTAEEVVSQTVHAVEKIRLPAVHEPLGRHLCGLPAGLWGVGPEGDVVALDPDDGLDPDHLPSGITHLYLTGALTDRTAERLRRRAAGLTLVAADFSRIFLGRSALRAWRNAGGRVGVVRRTHLVALCINPLAPDGRRLDAPALCSALHAATGMPTYDLIGGSHAA